MTPDPAVILYDIDANDFQTELWSGLPSECVVAYCADVDSYMIASFSGRLTKRGRARALGFGRGMLDLRPADEVSRCGTSASTAASTSPRPTSTAVRPSSVP